MCAKVKPVMMIAHSDYAASDPKVSRCPTCGKVVAMNDEYKAYVEAWAAQFANARLCVLCSHADNLAAPYICANWITRIIYTITRAAMDRR